MIDGPPSGPLTTTVAPVDIVAVDDDDDRCDAAPVPPPPPPPAFGIEIGVELGDTR